MVIKSREELEALYGAPYYCIGDGGKGPIYYTAKELARHVEESKKTRQEGAYFNLKLESTQSAKWLDEFYSISQEGVSFPEYFAKKMIHFFKPLQEINEGNTI